MSAPPSNVILIGMPGSGKSTVGIPLAKTLQYDLLDTDRLIEEGEGKPLSAVVSGTSREGFIALEADYITRLNCRETVVSTGGSVIYDPAAMAHLRRIGSVVFLDVPLAILEERLADLAARGVVIPKGLSIADLARQRRPYYLRYADLIVEAGDVAPAENAKSVLRRLYNAPSRFDGNSG